MVKIIVNSYPTIAAASAEKRRALRPIGRNSERYHEVLKGWMDIVRACDEMDGGVWGCSAIEHHFHSEGYEMSPNLGIINAYCAAMTKNVHVGQMGCVMSAHHPLRIAEETAILDLWCLKIPSALPERVDRRSLRTEARRCGSTGGSF